MIKKYTKELLEPLVKKHSSFSDILRELKPDIKSDGTTYIIRAVRKFGLDTSHFKYRTKRYTKEILSIAVQSSTSILGVLRSLNIPPSSGGMNAHIKNRIKFFKIDTTHFQGQAWNKGKPGTGKLNWSEVLVLNRLNGRKEGCDILRRSMIESGIEYRCECCGIPPIWNGKPLTLETDHKNGNNIDNRKDNLRFLCLNCHSQTDTFRSRNARKADCPDDGTVDELDLKSNAALAA
jgi:hypothetical protein